MIVLGIAAGKVAISILSAFALVYFRFPFRMAAFWLIFASLMLPVEIRIASTFAVMSNVLSPVRELAALFGFELRLRWSMLNSCEGLILPLVGSATATFLFRQFFLTVPDELAEASQVDGARPMRFFRDNLLPLSGTSIAALMVVMFVYGWNRYLWPLLVTTRPEMHTVVMGISKLMPGMDARPKWNLVMAAALVVLAPPTLVVVVLQRWFVKGLIDSDR